MTQLTRKELFHELEKIGIKETSEKKNYAVEYSDYINHFEEYQFQNDLVISESPLEEIAALNSF